MSFEVIKEGQFNTKYVKECESCHAVFVFKIVDLSYDVDIGSYYAYCPECGHKEAYQEKLLEEYNPRKSY